MDQSIQFPSPFDPERQPQWPMSSDDIAEQFQPHPVPSPYPVPVQLTAEQAALMDQTATAHSLAQMHTLLESFKGHLPNVSFERREEAMHIIDALQQETLGHATPMQKAIIDDVLRHVKQYRAHGGTQFFGDDDLVGSVR